MPSAGAPRLVLVHGSVVGGRPTWREQRRSITCEARLVVLERPGFPPGPVEEVDFERHAEWVAERVVAGDHLVGHSYGGVIALLAAATVGERLGSLTVIEPPCTRVALDVPGVAAFARAGAELYASGAHLEPETFLRTFLGAVGSDFDPPTPLPPALEQGARALAVERGPWEAEIPLEELAALDLPTLVVSGDHHPAFEAICDVLERELRAERVVVPGHGHNPQLDPAFTGALLDFVGRAEKARGTD
ncbi:MAG TPA: alpha/beta hydrolase [Gaiella sp.]|uniref:alpha/beta fold hydrolase n=1 Tax=Gaiella sp. TaxID=2663207 RepID=UPI002D7FDE4C|nr:alpha/beta hydrolase [Gaiella sp.]HET9286765.1 alpha/beta hydrolase [Gaiella sp.]